MLDTKNLTFFYSPWTYESGNYDSLQFNFDSLYILAYYNNYDYNGPFSADTSWIHSRIALKLYNAGQSLLMIEKSEDYKKYIRELPQYNRLTMKDLKMMGIGDDKLVNNHLTSGLVVQLFGKI